MLSADLDFVLPPQETSFLKSSLDTVEMHAPSVLSFPLEKYSWQRENTLSLALEDISDGQAGRFLVSLNGRTLYIMNAARADGGDYICTVSNPYVTRKIVARYHLRMTAGE